MQKIFNLLALSTIFFFCKVQALQTATYQYTIKPIPASQQNLMQKYSWHPGCPVALSDLRLIELNYYGFDSKIHNGELISNAAVANDLALIFQQLFNQHFPINKIIPIDAYQGDDQRAMLDNDTYAFDCRALTGYQIIFSQHSYGTAIDINPVENPYVHRHTILPLTAKNNVSRSQNLKGMITENSFVYRVFHRAGWQWGGDWQTLKDYQHFQKQ